MKILVVGVLLVHLAIAYLEGNASSLFEFQVHIKTEVT